MDLAVGQGELLTDPLQMAVAYSTLANAYRNGGSGTVVTPHLGKQIDEANGTLVQTLHFPSRHVRLNDEDLSLVMEGIHEAATAPGGTSTPCGSAGTRRKTRSTARRVRRNAPDSGTVLVHVLSRWRAAPDRHRGDRRARRLRRRNRGPDRSPDRLAVVRKAKKFVAGTSKTF